MTPLSEAELQSVRDNALALAQMAKEEDVGPGDITSALLSGDHREGVFQLVARERGILAGAAIADVILGVYSSRLKIEFQAGDGDLIEGAFATLSGPVDVALSVERVLLNFLQRLCGVATRTRAFVDAVRGTSARVYDTRKTTPGWRRLEKYAVRCGGGESHRLGLYDAVLIKDNHLADRAAGGLAGHLFQLLNRLDEITNTLDEITNTDEITNEITNAEDVPSSRSFAKPKFVEVEVDSLEQFEAVLDVVGVDMILLDNFSLDAMREAVSLRDARNLKGRIELEASGGATLDTIRAIAETGVDRISVGAMTHSAPALDIGLDARDSGQGGVNA
jgi:nicotinate-nucleotide pyrophosphorylase (carboxylating)